MALGHMGLVNSDGTVSPAADALRASAVPCLNAVIAEVSGYNEAATGLPITPARVTSLADEIECDVYISDLIIPAGLVRYLAVRFDPELAAYYRAEFYDCLKLLMVRVKATGEEIKEVY
jgi:hypothetical protein